MKMKQKVISFFIISIFVLSIVSFAPFRFYSANAPQSSDATLTGNIIDKGVDTDGDGLFAYLQVAVEINVSKYGNYYVMVDWLEELPPSNKTLTFYAGQSGYLEAGTQFLNLSFNGFTIFTAHFDPAYIHHLTLFETSINGSLDERFQVPLSRVYSYLEFEQYAKFTGLITDRGVDSDNDGLFDYLEVDVEVYAFDSGWYYVQTHGLQDSMNNTLDIWQSGSSYFDAGTAKNITLSFYGPLINQAHFNPAFISNLTISYYYGMMIDERFHVPLSRQYNYSEFDSRAVLTGKISDSGVDIDGDDLFDFLEIGVEVNVTQASLYGVFVKLNTMSGRYIENSTWMYLPVGLQVVKVDLNGPIIRASKMNFSNVYAITLNDEVANLDSRYNVPLSKNYSYTEFDTAAYFTGTVFDRGVDTDADSRFEYLEVDVQINVTRAGQYGFYANGLFGDSSSGGYLYDYKSGNFAMGLQFVNFTFPSELIYFYKVNLTSIQSIQIYGGASNYWTVLDQLNYVNLSRTYYYYEFDPHALLTGKVYDQGVDADHDGLFDYLDVSVEVNVTEAGKYGVMVSGLVENYSLGIYDYQTAGPFDLGVGVHLFNFTFYGPEIAHFRVNPRNITYVYIAEFQTEFQTDFGTGTAIDYAQSASLLTLYNYSQFDHPFNDMQATFTVYPDGSVGIDAMINDTHMYPRNVYGPIFNASAAFSNVDSSVIGSVNGSVGLPPYVTVPWPYPYYSAQFPTNTTIADFLSEYNNGILTAQLNASTVFPSIVKTQYPYNSTDFTFSGTFMDGLVHARLNGSSVMPSSVAMMLPFNTTDATVLANFADNQFTGNITVHVISGLPLGDLTVDFKGNRSAMLFTGFVDAIYGTYMGVEVNATWVSQAISELNSTFVGTGPDSLYTATQGILECTGIQTKNTTIAGGVRIDYNVTVVGDFGELIAYSLASYFHYSPTPEEIQFSYAAVNATLASVDNLSLVLAYTHAQQLAQLDMSFDGNAKTLWSSAIQLIPPTIPPEVPSYEKDQINTILKLGNATAYAAQNAQLYASYKSQSVTPNPTLDLRMALTANITQLKNDTINIIPDLAYPNEVRNIIKSYLNKTYAELDSCNTTIHLQDGVADFRIDFTFKGDFKGQLTAAKSSYLSFLNVTYPYQYNWQMKLLNQTLVDINNLKIDLKVGREYAFVNLKALLLFPEKQTIDNYRFKLWNLFNATSMYNEPPVRYEKLRIVIQGGSSSDHTILPALPPGTLAVPAPDSVSLDGKTFTWENTTVSSLRELVFQVAYQGSYQYAGLTYYVPILSNSTASNFNFDLNAKTLSFNVNGTSGTAGFCNITIPRSLLDVNIASEWIIRKDGNLLNSTQYIISQNAGYTFIYIAYTQSSHTISVQGTKSVPEMPPNMLVLIVTLVGMVAIALAVIERKRMRRLKALTFNVAYKITAKLQTFIRRRLVRVIQKNTASN